MTVAEFEAILYITIRKEGNMQIQVFHKAFEDTATHVATVTAPSTDVMEALEYAYRWTNNVMGSWSIQKEMLGEDFANGDLNTNVTVEAPLHVGDDGKEWGHRSTSVGDYMVVDGTEYSVASFGFNKKEI